MSENKKQDNAANLEQSKKAVSGKDANAIIDEIESFVRDFKGDENVKYAWLAQRFNDLRGAI